MNQQNETMPRDSMPRDFSTKKLQIIEAMQKANRPLILQHIAKAAKVTPQLVSYFMKQMIEWGIAGIYPVEQDLCNTYYALQPAYYDKKWLDALFLALTPFVEEMAKNIDVDQAKIDTSAVVIHNLSMFLRLFEHKIQKLDLKEQKES